MKKKKKQNSSLQTIPRKWAVNKKIDSHVIDTNVYANALVTGNEISRDLIVNIHVWQH